MHRDEASRCLAAAGMAWIRVRVINEIIFIVEEAPEGGYTARALGQSIFTEADDPAQLQERVRDAVRCHFDEECEPDMIRRKRLHFVREEIIAS